jgi:hypothetical protein
MQPQNVFRPSRRIPKALRDQVHARCRNRCGDCGRELHPDDLEIDHITPVAMGGTNIFENLRSICTRCNRKKGASVPVCPRCKRWNIGGAHFCAFCKNPLNPVQAAGTRNRFVFSSRRKLLVVVAIVCLVLGGLPILAKVISGALQAMSHGFQSSSAQQSAVTIANQSFDISPRQHVPVPFTVAGGTSNARVVGGLRVTSGSPIGFYLVDKNQYAQWANGGQLVSRYALTQTLATRVKQSVDAGEYYLIFYNSSNFPSTVAAELYLKTD